MARFPLPPQRQIPPSSLNPSLIHAPSKSTSPSPRKIPLPHQRRSASAILPTRPEPKLAPYNPGMSISSILPRGSSSQAKGDVPDFSVQGWYGEKEKTRDARGSQTWPGSTTIGLCGCVWWCSWRGYGRSGCRVHSSFWLILLFHNRVSRRFL